MHQQHRYETDFVYQEVFVDQVYTRDFPDLPPAPCVIDVGANIGLFSLFIKQRYPQAQIHAFEPSPAHFELLLQNVGAQDGVQCFREGLGETEARKTLTCYPDYSLLSGFQGDPQADRALLGAGIAQQLHLDPASPDGSKYVALLSEGKLDRVEQIECPVTTLATFMKQYAITRIDLLKIDAEKAEKDVLAGIAAHNWPCIDRLVLEAHSTANATTICKQLEDTGYRVTCEKTADFGSTALYTVRAIRQEIAGS